MRRLLLAGVLSLATLLYPLSSRAINDCLGCGLPQVVEQSSAVDRGYAILDSGTQVFTFREWGGYSRSYKTHKVKPKDTLWEISREYTGTPLNWKTIADENEIKNPKSLRIGTVLRIPNLETKTALNTIPTQDGVYRGLHGLL